MSKARRRSLLASMILVVAAMLVTSSPAWALPLAAYWEMNETSGDMLDSSGNNNNGTPMNLEDRTGSTYVFNGFTTPASRVVVPDADSLDPDANSLPDQPAKDITLTARVLVGEEGEGVNTHQMDDDSYDVVRKGFITTAGGDYKMEIKRVKADPTIGRLHCFFRGTLEDGTDDSVARVARPDVVDGNWHTLRCEKKSDSVVATVDGKPFTTTGSADSIDNAENVMVGAKTVTVTRRGLEKGDDVFDGSMDYVSIEINQPDIAQ